MKSMMPKKYAEGGEVNEKEDSDSEMMMDHISKEAIHAVHSHDHESFKNSMRAMFDLHKSSVDEAMEGDE